MSRLTERARTHRARLRAGILAAHPGLRPAARRVIDRSALVLGRDLRGAPVAVPLAARLEHTQLIGTTGAGKTRLIEHLVRQDIRDGRGVCVLDPHGNHPGSLYRALLAWLAATGPPRPVHLIDPNAGTHLTGLDPLAAPSPDYEPSVIAEAVQEALERLWGEERMDTKPTMQRVLAAVLSALAELRLSLPDARYLFDPADRHGVRALTQMDGSLTRRLFSLVEMPSPRAAPRPHGGGQTAARSALESAPPCRAQEMLWAQATCGRGNPPAGATP